MLPKKQESVKNSTIHETQGNSGSYVGDCDSKTQN